MVKLVLLFYEASRDDINLSSINLQFTVDIIRPWKKLERWKGKWRDGSVPPPPDRRGNLETENLFLRKSIRVRKMVGQGCVPGCVAVRVLHKFGCYIKKIKRERKEERQCWLHTKYLNPRRRTKESPQKNKNVARLHDLGKRESAPRRLGFFFDIFWWPKTRRFVTWRRISSLSLLPPPSPLFTLRSVPLIISHR